MLLLLHRQALREAGEATADMPTQAIMDRLDESVRQILNESLPDVESVRACICAVWESLKGKLKGHAGVSCCRAVAWLSVW